MSRGSQESAVRAWRSLWQRRRERAPLHHHNNTPNSPTNNTTENTTTINIQAQNNNNPTTNTNLINLNNITFTTNTSTTITTNSPNHTTTPNTHNTNTNNRRNNPTTHNDHHTPNNPHIRNNNPNYTNPTNTTYNHNNPLPNHNNNQNTTYTTNHTNNTNNAPNTTTNRAIRPNNLQHQYRELPSRSTRRIQARRRRSRAPTTSSSFAQRSLLGGSSSDDTRFGDPLPSKTSSSFRILFQNANKIPTSGSSDKSSTFINLPKQFNLDVFGFSEVGLDWRLVDEANSMWERTRNKYRSCKSVTRHNTNDPPTNPLQYGGTGMMAVNEAVSRIVGIGGDTTGLGRWSWTRLQGQNNTHVRVISAYRPCTNNSDIGSTYQQHLRYFRSMGNFADPRDLFLDHLATAIGEWQNDGDSIILGMDANQDIRAPSIKHFCDALHLSETVLSRHPTQPPIATYNRNQSDETIDGIFISSHLNPVACGYLAFEEGCPSDHRAIWIDFSRHDLFGLNQCLPPPRRVLNLQAKNPRLVSTYNKRVKKVLEQQGVIKKLDELDSKARRLGFYTSGMQEDYSNLYEQQKQLRLQVERTLKKKRVGAPTRYV